MKTANRNHKNLKHNTLHPKMAKFSEKKFSGLHVPRFAPTCHQPPHPLRALMLNKLQHPTDRIEAETAKNRWFFV